MIQIPDPYPDELFSSVLMRYHVYSGNITARQSNEELFSGKKKLLDVELLGQLQDEVMKRMQEIKPLSNWAEEHTLLAQYSRFLPVERREKAVKAVQGMDPHADYLLYKPKQRKDKYLKYCMKCVAEDRSRYGEAYWHRIHQIQGVTICPAHGIRLIESATLRSGSEGGIANAAEIVIGEGGEKSAETEKDSVERKLSIYMAKVMEQPVAVSNDVDIADFLQYRLREKYPVGDRGGLTDLDRVVEEIREYYDSLPDFPKDMKALLKRIQHKIAFPHMEICMPGMFLGVAPEEIADIRLPAEERTEAYDAEILRLYKDGLSFAEISRKTGAEPWRVNDICKDRYGHRGEKSSRRRYQKMDRAELDRKYYPQVCEIIREIEYNDGGCPGRVTLNGVAARLGIRNRLLSELPECIEEIERCACTVEENRAKKLLWAGRKAIENGQILNKQRIMEYVCLDRKAVVSALPYLEKYADGEVCRQVKELVGSEEP